MEIKDKQDQTPTDWNRKYTEVYFMLFHLYYEPKRAAAEANISYMTVCRWIKKHNWKNRIKAIKEGRTKKPMKYDFEGVTLRAHIRIHDKALSEKVEAYVTNKFLPSLKN